MSFQQETRRYWKCLLASTAAKETVFRAVCGKLLLEIFPWLD